MKKVLIVGSPYPVHIEKLKNAIGSDVSIVVTEHMGADRVEFLRTACEEYDQVLVVSNDAEELERGVDIKSLANDIKKLDYTMPKMIERPFSPKKKHSPKGHERKYKYHK